MFQEKIARDYPLFSFCSSPDAENQWSFWRKRTLVFNNTEQL